MEFAPDATPRAVETSDAAGMSRAMFVELVRLVYGSAMPLPASLAQRIEFSVHPKRVGVRSEHVIVWEQEAVAPCHSRPR